MISSFWQWVFNTTRTLIHAPSYLCGFVSQHCELSLRFSANLGPSWYQQNIHFSHCLKHWTIKNADSPNLGAWGKGWIMVTGHPSGLKLFYQTDIRSILTYAASMWPSFLSKYNIIKLERIQKMATKIICATGNLELNYEQWLNATDMPSTNDFLTEVCHEYFYRVFRNDKHPLFSIMTFNHRVSSRRQFRQSRCRTATLQKAFF